MQVCKEDFEEALKEVKPAFGAVTELLEAYRLNGIIDYGEHFRHLLSVCKQLVEQASLLSCHPVYPNIPLDTFGSRSSGNGMEHLYHVAIPGIGSAPRICRLHPTHMQ